MRYLLLPSVISLIFVTALALPGQTLRVLSEFQRIDPFGEVIGADHAFRRREILSPGVARNAFASFHVAVTSQANTSYFLYAQTYPPDVFKISIYKARYRRLGDTWIPDVLEETRLPSFGAMPDAQEQIAGQTTRTYWLDVWVPPDAAPGSVRFEVLIKSARWTVHPMEIRVLRARVPNLLPAPLRALPPADLPADAAAFQPIADFLEGKPPVRYPGVPGTIREGIRRNVSQDMAVASHDLLQDVMQRLWRRILAPWPNEGAEWYLQLRDLILRQASN